MKRRNLLPVLLLLALAGCRPAGLRELAPRAVLQTPISPLPGTFSLAGGADSPYLAYVDRDTRALVLAAVDGSSPPSYLDRITDLAEQDPLAGAHVMFAAGDDLHLVYLDRQSEDNVLVKHVRKSMSSGISWIDLLPGSGLPLAAFVTQRGLEVFFERDQALFREGPPAGQSGLMRAPFRSEGPACSFAAGGLEGFTVYDGATHRLLLFRLRGQEVQTLEVARFGQAQYSAVDSEGRLEILAYDPRSFRILLFRTEDPAAGFDVQPVTLSRGTSALALVRLPDGTAFLFNEVSARERPRHQLSLLHFSPAAGYRKTVLYRSEHPLTALRVMATNSALFVALLEEDLRVLRVEYESLRER